MVEDFCLLALGCAEDGHVRQEAVWRRHGVGCLRELLEVHGSVIVALLSSLEDRIVEAEVLGRAMRVFQSASRRLCTTLPEPRTTKPSSRRALSFCPTS